MASTSNQFLHSQKLRRSLHGLHGELGPACIVARGPWPVARGPCGVDVSVYAGSPTFGGGGSPTFGGMKVSTFGGGVGRGWVNIVVVLVEEEVRWRELRI